MKIERTAVERIIREVLAEHIGSLLEKDEQKKDVEVQSNDNEPKNDKNKVVKKELPPKQKAVSAEKEQLPSEDKLDEPKQDVENQDNKEKEVKDAEEITGSEITDELTGKTIQSMTMEPKSKLMPGAQEINITFKEITDPLKILIGSSGVVKFYFRGIKNKL